MPQRLPSFEAVLPPQEASSTSSDEKSRWRLRGLLWRMQLGVLPSHFDSVDALRRAAADGRRRYADLRRKLLVDPHLVEEGQKPPDAGMDNPLSLDPDSVWGKYFRNAEIERVIDKDLVRLYPEHGDFFQSSGCQAMLRRILLVWSLIHPQLSYRQGMHELLAPLLYVLHVDVVHLSQIKKKYEDLFDDRFDEDASVVKVSKLHLPFDFTEDKLGDHKTNGQEEPNVDLKVLVMGSDLYGAEGELGALFSPRFMEHDAYCMFDALLNRQGGAVRMSEYFSSSGIPDASAALYRALAAIDIALYTHFVELGVQPQYFALRWLRLLFGREFILEDLLLVWDAIFSASNEILSVEGDDGSGGPVSARSALISAIAVSILLHSRPALLAAPDATGCLQRLLSSPNIPDVRSFLENAKLLQPIAQAAAVTPPPPVAKHSRTPAKSSKPGLLRHQHSAPCSPELLKLFLAEGYWEEKWRTSVLEKASVEDPVKQQQRRDNKPSKGKKFKAPVLESQKSQAESSSTEPEVSSEAPLKDSNEAATVNSEEDKASAAVTVNENSRDSVKQSDNENDQKEPAASNKTARDSKVRHQNGRSGKHQVQEEIEDPLGIAVSPSTSSSTALVDHSISPPTSTVLQARPGDEALPAVSKIDEAPARLGVSKLDEVQSRSAAPTSKSKTEEVQARLGVPTSNKSRPEEVQPRSELTTAKAMSEGVQALTTTYEVHSRPTFKTKLEEMLGRQDKALGASPRSLGQAMVEQIRVLESVLADKSKGAEKGYVSAVTALAELRKISNALQQM